MAVSCEPTKQHWHPSSLLPYDALPNPHDDLDLIQSNPRSTAGTGTDFYDRGLTSRRYALVGVAFSSIIGCCCIATGAFTVATYGVSGVTPLIRLEGSMENSTVPSEILSLILNLIVTICTESTGFVHSISLRSALASESRLRFNTNLRLLTAARGWRSPNGALLNGIMAVLIISYTSSSLVAFVNTTWDDSGFVLIDVAIAGLPVLLLGIALLLSSPFDLTVALVHHAQLTPVTFRCMRGVSHLDVDGGPAKPSETQPSAWHAHSSIRKVVIFLWGIVVACAGWAALAMCIWHKYPNVGFWSLPLTTQTWSFLSNDQSNVIGYIMPDNGIRWWILVFVTVAVVQGPLTLALHCSELIANNIRDDRQWRCATGRKGLRMTTNPLKPIFTHPICLVLFIVKPFLHWMFGLSFQVSDSATDEALEFFVISMFTAQIWNLCIALFIFACFFTLVALSRPHGPQPATYGHLQTLANLVDEWSPVMWWGHKEDRIPYCHAGTSDHPLPDVKMDCVYAGSSVKSPTSVS
ncbi:hypothetical protein EDB19DRAFT_812927 [Suillus lakei]|nr:hypothetical protein EDB19DRAFT_812927 [Suillus lakei]